MTTKRRWHGHTLMRWDEVLARIEPHHTLWRVHYLGATSSPTTRSIAARLAELAARHD